VPPAAFASVVGMLGATGLAEGGHCIIEKPFGVDLASPRKLNDSVHEVFSESRVFRIDHFPWSRTSRGHGARPAWTSWSRRTAGTSGNFLAFYACWPPTFRVASTFLFAQRVANPLARLATRCQILHTQMATDCILRKTPIAATVHSALTRRAKEIAK
jgi:hypothetical protein